MATRAMLDDVRTVIRGHIDRAEPVAALVYNRRRLIEPDAAGRWPSSSGTFAVALKEAIAILQESANDPAAS